MRISSNSSSVAVFATTASRICGAASEIAYVGRVALGWAPNCVPRDSSSRARLGPVAAGALGGEAEDGRQPVPPRDQEGRRVVPAQPSPADSGAVRGSCPEATGALRVLRGDRQSGLPESLPV